MKQTPGDSDFDSDESYKQAEIETFGSEEFFPAYPTEWHTFDVLRGVESRQLSSDTFEVRDDRYVMVLNLEGYNLYRDDSPQGRAIFDDWLVRNKINGWERQDEQS